VRRDLRQVNMQVNMMAGEHDAIFCLQAKYAAKVPVKFYSLELHDMRSLKCIIVSQAMICIKYHLSYAVIMHFAFACRYQFAAHHFTTCTVCRKMVINLKSATPDPTFN